MELFLAASATVTKAVDFTRNAFDKANKAPAWVWNLMAFAYGIVISYTLDLATLPIANSVPELAATIITGMAIGAAASGFHEVFDFFSSKASGAKSK